MINFLSKNPIIGIISGLGSSLIQYINAIEPFYKIFGYVVGIIIAILTVYAKIIEIKNHSKKNN